MIDRFDLVVAREPRPLDSLFLIFLMVFITLLNFGFGCSLNLELVVKILKRPIAPAIGFACQFCIMPLVSVLFKIFNNISRELNYILQTLQIRTRAS
jgi:predicted Na+-dependent transporter